MIVVVDYGLGNLASVRNALRYLDAEATVSADKAAIEMADALVLPGVGAASAGMERLHARGQTEPIRRAAAAGKPILGLCLGMQLLFEYSDEGDSRCLGLLPGRVRLLRDAPKVPHIGWNRVRPSGHDEIWKGQPSDPYFYFVHSYVCEPTEPGLIAGTTDYGEEFCAVVARGPIWATQFHPERSGETGLRLIQNFLDICPGEGGRHGSHNATATTLRT
jgi:glutamine amidotransferase